MTGPRRRLQQTAAAPAAAPRAARGRTPSLPGATPERPTPGWAQPAAAVARARRGLRRAGRRARLLAGGAGAGADGRPAQPARAWPRPAPRRAARSTTPTASCWRATCAAPNGERLREYPYSVAAPVIGYSSAVFGTAALERTYDAQLTGLVSLRPGDELLRKFRGQPYDPSDLHLSLDIELQRVAADLLGDQKGAVVAIEPATGRILALVSSPTLQPQPRRRSGRRAALHGRRSRRATTRRCSTAPRRACTCPARCSRS